jgi:hypothetical protein
MAEETDEFGDILDDASENEEQSDKGTSSAGEDTKSGESKDDNNDRVRTLQSKADKAEAEANKLRKQLESLSGKESASSSEPAVPPQVAEWLSAAEDRLRDQLYREDPRFEEYDISADRISGKSPAEMRASAKNLAETIDKMEQAIRTKVQVEHGIAPPPSSGPPEKRTSFDKMSSEEFNTYVEKALRG